MTSGIAAYIIMLLMRIPLARVIGDEGVGLFAPAFEIFVLVTLYTSHSVSKSMSALMRYRVKRDQYRNARKVFRAAFWMNLIVGAAAAFVILILSSVISGVLALEPLSRMAVMMTAPVVFFAALTGVFRGYFNGYGLSMLAAYSHYIEAVGMAVFSTVCGGLFHAHGEKVAALLKVDAHASSYGALGAMTGVMLAQVVTMIYALVMFAVYHGALQGKPGQDNNRRVETQGSLQIMILGNCIPTAFVAAAVNVCVLIDQRFFHYSMTKQEMDGVRTALWGGYYGKAAVVIGVLAAVVCLCVQTSVGRIGSAYEREEYRVMRERLAKAVKKLCIAAFPLAVYMAVSAKAIAETLFKGESDSITGVMQRGAVVVILYGFCFLFGQLMLRIRMIKEILATTVIFLAVHIVSAYFLVQRFHFGAEGIIYALIVSFAVYAALNFLLVCHSLQYRQDWIGTVAFAAGSAAVSGLIVLLLNHLLLSLAGGVITILLSCLVGVILYIIMLMFLRVVGEAELSAIPFGFLFITLGRNIGVL